MKRQMRQRTVLIPARAMLNSLPNPSGKSFSDEERKMVVKALLEELAWVNYGTLPRRFSFVNPPYRGRAFNILTTLDVRADHDETRGNIFRVTRGITRTLEAQIALSADAFPSTDGDFIATPYLFDHGVGFNFIGDMLQISWVRPVVDMKEMTVSTYLKWLSRQYATRKYSPDSITQRINTTDINEVLKVGYEPV